MRAADELQAPVGYDDRWLLLVVLGIAAITAYYVGVIWWTRDRPSRQASATLPDSWINRLDRIDEAVRQGSMTARQGHQAISQTVRAFVADRSGVPAPTMTLADLRQHGPDRLTELVALIYPPSFSADDQLPTALFEQASTRARSLVATWT